MNHIVYYNHSYLSTQYPFSPLFLTNGELILLREAKYPNKKEFGFPGYPFN